MKLAAHLISYIFHPLLFTTYLVLFLGNFFPAILGIPLQALYLFSLFIFVITFIFPALNIVLMVKYSGAKASFTMASRRERLVPFILISGIYVAVTCLFFYKATLGINFNRLMVIIAALVVVATAITFFYKISVHSVAIGGFVGILGAMNILLAGAVIEPMVITIVVAGLVMSSRLFLNAHTLSEVMTGMFTGLFVGLGGMILLF